jgi:hypothetical protein
MRSPCVCVNFDSKAVYQSLHRLTIIPPILGSATLVTGNKSWELPTNCRKTMLELVRIFELNECHRSGDLEPQTRGNHAMAESEKPKYDTLRLPTRTSIWRPRPRHPICFSTCKHWQPLKSTSSSLNAAVPWTTDIVSAGSMPDLASGLCGRLPRVRRLRNATQGYAGS